MLDVFLCHSPSDLDLAQRIAARLEKCAEAKVWLEALDSDSFVTDEWEGGLPSGAILLMLRPEAVPARVRLDDWQQLLDHALTHARPPVACVLTSPCAYPPLLQRKNFFPWSEDVMCLRAIERWVVGLHESAGRRSFEPAPLPWFEEGSDEIDVLWNTLVDNGGGLCTIAGPAGAGKSALAQEFARVAGEQFREVIWVPCGESSDAFIVGDLAAQLDVLDARSIPHLLREHRLLVVFDDVRRRLPDCLDDIGGGRSSVLITTQGTGVDTTLTLSRVSARVSGATPTLDEANLHLWHALSLCRRESADIVLAGRIAGMHKDQLNAAVKQLEIARVLDRLDASRVRVIHSCAAPDAAALRRRHAEEVHASLPECWTELASALRFAIDANWDFAQRLGQHAADLLRLSYRTAEAVEVLEMLLTAADRQGREEAAHHFRWELSWVRGDSGEVRRPMVAEQQLQLGLEW